MKLNNISIIYIFFPLELFSIFMSKLIKKNSLNIVISSRRPQIHKIQTSLKKENGNKKEKRPLWADAEALIWYLLKFCSSGNPIKKALRNNIGFFCPFKCGWQMRILEQKWKFHFFGINDGCLRIEATAVLGRLAPEYKDIAIFECLWDD